MRKRGKPRLNRSRLTIATTSSSVRLSRTSPTPPATGRDGVTTPATERDGAGEGSSLRAGVFRSDSGSRERTLGRALGGVRCRRGSARARRCFFPTVSGSFSPYAHRPDRRMSHRSGLALTLRIDRLPARHRAAYAMSRREGEPNRTAPRAPAAAPPSCALQYCPTCTFGPFPVGRHRQPLSRPVRSIPETGIDFGRISLCASRTLLLARRQTVVPGHISRIGTKNI